MQVTPRLSDLDLLASDLVRSPGLHISAIYTDLYQDLEPKRYTRGTAPDVNRMGLGFALEAGLEEGLKKHLASRPGEFRTPEGIAFSPDLLITNGIVRVGEIKLTWMSSRDVPREPGTSFPPKFSKWFVQMKAYCHHLETPYARLYAFFVNGNYREHTPEFLSWDVEFSSGELHENWAMLLNHARAKGML